MDDAIALERKLECGNCPHHRYSPAPDGIIAHTNPSCHMSISYLKNLEFTIFSSSLDWPKMFWPLLGSTISDA
jgi:hypothetical protein